MNPIIAVEDHIVNAAQQVFKTGLKIDTLPSALNLGLLKTLITKPGIYVVFLGGPGSNGFINGRFDVYIITRHLGNDEARRRGSSTNKGAYDIIAVLADLLHDDPVPKVGTLMLKGVKNLFSMQLEENFKAAMYAMTFELPNMPFPRQDDLSALANFETYYAEHSMAEGDDEPDAIDQLTLDQGTEQ